MTEMDIRWMLMLFNRLMFNMYVNFDMYKFLLRSIFSQKIQFFLQNFQVPLNHLLLFRTAQ
jgi:hypothetical protein